jgi:hypothetical protein
MISGFYLTTMSIDRLLAVRFPMAASRICTPGRAKRVIAIGTFLIIGVNVNLLFTLHYVKEPATGRYTCSFCINNNLAGPFFCMLQTRLFLNLQLSI